MGDFDPAFTYGNGISGTNRTANNDGTFVFEWSGFVDSIKQGAIPSSITNPPLPPNYYQLLKEFFSTAVTTGEIRTSTARVLPVSYFHVGLPRSKSTDPVICVDVPMKGMWVDANAQMFSYGFSFNGKTANASSKFSFEASSPHFLADGVTLNPARFAMFIPDSYVTSLGYTAETFTVSALKISVSDGQTANPVLTRTTGGFGLDFGIGHYSSPNPVVEILNANWTAPVESVPTSAPTTIAASTSATLPAASIAPSRSVVRGKTVSMSSMTKASGLTRPSGASVSLRLKSGGTFCRVSSTGVRGLKAGTCKVTVTVRAKGKPAKSAVVTVKVSN